MPNTQPVPQKSYSLVPFSQDSEPKNTEEKRDALYDSKDDPRRDLCEQQPDAQPAPEMWFNPATNRWCSKSCRRYRELIRDQERIKRGLPPGPQQNVVRQTNHKKQKLEPKPELSQPKQTPCTEEAIKKRDAYFARFGL